MPELELDELDVALAIMRGRDFRHNFSRALTQPKNRYTQHSAAEYGGMFEGLLRECNAFLFQDSYTEDAYVPAIAGSRLDDPNRPGNTNEPWKNELLRHEANYLASQLFSGSVMTAKKEDLPEILAESYVRLKKMEPFARGNGMTLGLFFACVADLAQQRNIFFDTRRISDDDHKLLATIDRETPEIRHLYGDRERKDERINETITASTEKIKGIFSQALDRHTDMSPPRDVDVWEKLNDSSIEIGGHRFLKKELQGKRYLVTNNGGLVALNEPDHHGRDLESYLNEHISSERLIDQFRVHPKEGHYLPIQRQNHGFADGVSLEGGERLACLSLNPLTGLGSRYNERMAKFFERETDALRQAGVLNANDKLTFEDLARDDVVTALKGRLNEGDAFRQVLDTAAEHARGMMRIVNRAVAHAFEGKEPAGNERQFIMAQGGAASGKSSVENYAKTKCGNNYVTASLDNARENFQLYNIMLNLGHHADDYFTLNPVATMIREKIAKRAMDTGYNLLYDGTGIPYEGKYDALVQKFQKKGFETSVVGVDALLYIPPERADEFGESTPARKKARFQATGRTLPDNEMWERHEQAAQSFLAAAFDRNVTNFLLHDNAGPQGSEYLLAQRFKADAATKDRLNTAKKEGRLLETMEQLGWTPPLAESPKEMGEKDVTFISHKLGKDEYMFLAVYNKARFVDLARKSHLNEQPVGYDALPYMDDFSNWLVNEGIGTRDNRGVKVKMDKPYSHTENLTTRRNEGPSTGSHPSTLH